MRGRKPKPVELKRRDGNPGGRKLPSRAEAINSPAAYGPPPEYFSDFERREWNKKAKELRELGLLSVLDRTALEMYCVHYRQWLRACMQAENQPVPNNAMLEARQQAVILHRLLAEFGFTPSSRARLSISESKAPNIVETWIKDNPYEEDFKK